MTTTDTPQAALERLDATFDPDDFAVTLTLDEGRPPKLSISNRHCPLTDDVFCDGQRYWFSWGEPIGPIDDPDGAAAKIARVLRAAPEPSYG